MPRLFSLRFLVGLLAFVVALVSFRFLVWDLDLVFPSMTGHIDQRYLSFVAHIISAPIALVMGVLPFLFPRFPAANPIGHRWAGRIYGMAVLVGGVSGLSLAIGAEGGIAAQWGFGLLALAWLATTLRGIFLARSRQFRVHRQWMIRSFALSFAAVTLRIYLPILMLGGGMDYAEASVWVAWLCWVPNLVFAEWLIRRKKTAPAFQV